MKKSAKRLALAKETVRALSAVYGGTIIPPPIPESHSISCENSAYVDCWEPVATQVGVSRTC